MPNFVTAGEQTDTPTIYYFSPDEDVPSGGIRNIYRHVDALNGLGRRARVLHSRADFRTTWFQHQTPTVGAANAILHTNDLLVIPEFYGPSLGAVPADVPVVIFNQGAYHTFDFTAFNESGPGAPYRRVQRLLGLLTVSTESADVLAYTFPDLAIGVARQAIDPAVFHPNAGARGRRIAFTTHRRAAEREMLLHMLRARGVLDNWELVPITGKSEQETGDLMRSAPLFLSFSEREGFGLPPAEAMACGCFVVGFTGLAGREYFDPDVSAPVTESDVLAFAKAVEDACGRYDQDPHALASCGTEASARILARYTASGLQDDLARFYADLAV